MIQRWLKPHLVRLGCDEVDHLDEIRVPVQGVGEVEPASRLARCDTQGQCGTIGCAEQLSFQELLLDRSEQSLDIWIRVRRQPAPQRLAGLDETDQAGRVAHASPVADREVLAPVTRRCRPTVHASSSDLLVISDPSNLGLRQVGSPAEEVGRRCQPHVTAQHPVPATVYREHGVIGVRSRREELRGTGPCTGGAQTDLGKCLRHPQGLRDSLR